MPRKKATMLTNAEHRIMEVIWARGSATVADVVEALQGKDAYTTILTLIRILKAKGYLTSHKEGRAFIAHNGFPAGMVVVDTINETILNANVQIPGAQQPVGVSIDVEGYVWLVDQSCQCAFKVDPDTYQVVLQVNGLQQPYTYSDMTDGKPSKRIIATS